MAGACGSPEGAAEVLRSDTGVLLGQRLLIMVHRRPPLTLSGGRRSCVVERMAQFAPLDHPLLVEGLKIPDHLGNQADKLARDVSVVLLGQLTLLPSRHRSAERRLELRPAKLLTKRRHT